MSWLQRGTDERLVQAMQDRREVQRGPLPRKGAPDEEEAFLGSRVWAHAFGVSTLFLVILVVLMVGATLYYASYSGALRWLLFALVVGVLGFVAVRAVGGVVRDPARLDTVAAPGGAAGGDLGSLRTTLARATTGLAYSQLLFDDAMRKAFLEKVRVARDLPREAVTAALRDPAKLHALVGDRELTIFLLESARNSRLYPASVGALPKRLDFARRVAALLDRMEAWR